ncbi:hypothetical protein VULLAG_LOCUS19204 [Vulpes lagopus]
MNDYLSQVHPWLSILLCQWLCGSASPTGQHLFPTLTQISASFLTNSTRGSLNPGLGLLSGFHSSTDGQMLGLFDLGL